MRLERRAGDEDTVTLGATATFGEAPVRLRYATRTGALLRIDGGVVGAFDAKHLTCDLAGAPGAHELEIVVERRSLPIAGLPSGDGVRWRMMVARATAEPSLDLFVEPAEPFTPRERAIGVAAIGHAHLDVAWLWTYAEARRKATRTFATALRQIERGGYTFMQSQPQLAAWVAADAPALIERARAQSGHGWDASVASMWVEPDLHAPDGESILRQFAYGIRATQELFGSDASVAWLPDTFGFPSTLPQLAAHAGVTSFATTKVQWNDTTRWPHPQFVWHGADGSTVLAAVIDAYEGDPDPARVQRARERREPLIVGFGDGGGGATDDQIAQLDPVCWTGMDRWFATLEPQTLPAYEGELYLETHRGTYTTHRDVKARNAALERALAVAEEAVAWCVAVRTGPSVTAPLCDDLRTAWTIVLRNQFHDVISGTSIAAVYADVHEEYDRAERIVARVRESAISVLPRASVVRVVAAPTAPSPEDDGSYVLDNGVVRARVTRDGTLTELAAEGGPSVAPLANCLAAFVDKPKAWDAWNLDAGYERRHVAVRPQGATLDEDGVVVRLRIGKRSTASMRIELRAGEPFVRVELAVAWHEDHAILRVEHRLAVNAERVRFGAPHGSIERPTRPQTPAERARFEVPGQRWALVDDGTRGCAVLAPDTYGWSAQALRGGGVRLGMSLLRAPTWPDPTADRGDHRIVYALAPTAGPAISALEEAWIAYACEERVRLFTCDDPGVLVVATKPADDGDGVIVRVRECDGTAREASLRSGARVRGVESVDAVERAIPGRVALDGEWLRFHLPAFALRSFRVRS